MPQNMPRSRYEFYVLLLNRVATGGRRLHQSPERLHTAFYQLQQRYGDHFPELKDLRFITAGAFPYSPDLTEALDILQESGATSKDNPLLQQFAPKSFDGLDGWLREADARVTQGNDERRAALNRAVEDLSKDLLVGG